MLLFVSLWMVLPAFGFPPAHPPPINFICDITAVDKNHLKNQQSQLDGKIYLQIHSYISRLPILCVWRGYIVAITSESQWLQYFKLVFLEIQNVPLRTVFANPVTYTCRTDLSIIILVDWAACMVRAF